MTLLKEYGNQEKDCRNCVCFNERKNGLGGVIYWLCLNPKRNDKELSKPLPSDIHISCNRFNPYSYDRKRRVGITEFKCNDLNGLDLCKKCKNAQNLGATNGVLNNRGDCFCEPVGCFHEHMVLCMDFERRRFKAVRRK